MHHSRWEQTVSPTHLGVPLPDGEVQRRVAPPVLVVEQPVGRRRALQQQLHARRVAAGAGHVQHRRAVLEGMDHY